MISYLGLLIYLHFRFCDFLIIIIFLITFILHSRVQITLLKLHFHFLFVQQWPTFESKNMCDLNTRVL